MPSDYHHIPKLKQVLGDKQFANEEELKAMVLKLFQMVGTQFYTDGMNKLLSRYQKFIDRWKNKEYHILSLRIFLAIWQWLLLHSSYFYREILEKFSGSFRKIFKIVEEQWYQHPMNFLSES